MAETLLSPPEGCIKIIRGTPNPHGADEAQLFLLVGNPTAAPIRNIIPAEGVALPAARPDLLTDPFRLKILHINDLHGHISRFTAYGPQPVFSKIVWRLREARQQCRHNPHSAVLTLSAGDDLVGAVFDELLGDDPKSYQLHAGYRLYSAAGIDVAILGNHDLDMGTQLLAHAISREARFPLLAANLIGSHWLAGLYYPAALLVVKGIRIGLIGLITPGGIKPQLDSGIHVTNPVQTMHNLLPAMCPLCDVMIILSHLGYSLNANAGAVSEAGDVELARSLPPGSVHLIVGGHTHNVLNEQGLSAYNIVNDIPIVQAGTLGRFVGEVDITIQHSAAVTSARLTPTADLPTDEEFERQEVQPLLDMIRPVFARNLGCVAPHPDLSTDAIRNAFAADESALANFITDAMVTCCRANGYNADLAILDAPGVRCGVPVGGELTFGDWFNLMPFADTIRLCWITGYQLKALLNDNARRADRPGKPHTERGFLHFSRQVRYKIDLGQSRHAAQAIDITVDGLPLDEQLGRSFLIGCSSFVRQAALPWQKYASEFLNLPLLDIHSWPRLDTNLFLRDELITYIREQGGIPASHARRDGRVQFIWNLSPPNGV
ncbi:MAG TPA: 5'-nucleotidase C-terminal domain-containing protein [Anaerolineae bacterium]|nr:5'-nucleotidase C-terminal domain-containing protein [Anaerolineae bacterium]